MTPNGRTQIPEHQPEGGAFRPVLFYALAFAIAWGAWTPLLLHKIEFLRLPIPFVVALFVGQTLGAFAPLLSLLVIQWISNDPTLVKQVFSQLRFRGISIFWYLVPALTPIAITIAINLQYGLFSGSEITVLRPEPVQQLGWALLAVIPFQFMLGMIGSPLGEEPGWRGYILDRFSRRGRALAGSGIVAGLWWVWHLPLFVVLGVSPNGYTFLTMAGHSLLLDSLFLLSRNNLLVAMLYHQGINTSFLFLMSKAETPAGSALLLLVAIITRAVVHYRCALSPHGSVGSK
ncbi:MAG: CPBP family intramembrane glutamic endopeptidase [Lysobacterales bacterium]